MRSPRFDASSPASPRSAGFTLVELLVVITIIGMLMALLIPAVGAARATARKTECANNLRQLGIGMIAYQTAKGYFPGFVQPLERSGPDKTYLQVIEGQDGGGMADLRYTSTPERLRSRISWLAMLLPHIEGQETYDRMVDGSFTDGGTGNAVNPVSPFAVFVCPADNELKADVKNAGTSYVANTGSWDMNGTSLIAYQAKVSGDIKPNGLLFNLTSPQTGDQRQRMSSIRDGAGSTLMLSENIQKNTNYSWMGVDNGNAAIFGEQQLGFVWLATLDPQGETVGSELHQYAVSKENTGAPGVFPANLPQYARPGSAHAGGAVNAAMIEGGVKSINADIDYQVYQAIMTTEGRQCVYPVDHTAKLGSGDAIAVFRTRPPVAEKDFQ